MTIELASRFGSEGGTRYRLAVAVREAFPDGIVVELDKELGIARFAREGHAKIALRSAPAPSVSTFWRRRHGLGSHTKVGVFDVKHGGERFVAVLAGWRDAFREHEVSFVIGDRRETVDAFVEAVEVHANHPGRSVLVFQGGCWEEDDAMHEAIQAASFDDLVLAGSLAEDIQRDLTSFLGARELYARYGVPWKRGVLFLGPPGNGKTHCLRATARLLGVPCLFVRSLESRYGTDDGNVAAVFARAREIAPCCLVFEDLDALVNDKNRAQFLNELDGFADASGVLTLASTNHPERLDPALLDRPSRFDRKYIFALPAERDRARYLARWSTRAHEELALREEDIARVAAATDGFSFAYLKELVLAAMLSWMGDRARPIGAVVDAQVAELRRQMAGGA